MGRKRMTSEEFVFRAKLMHADAYDYTHSVYEGYNMPITIGCRKHTNSQWQTTPARHLCYSNNGCRECLRSKISLSVKASNANRKFASIYLIEIVGPSERFLKVGITSQSIEQRFSNYALKKCYSFEIIHRELVPSFSMARQIEQTILQEFIEFKYVPSVYFYGAQECLSVLTTTDVTSRIKTLVSTSIFNGKIRPFITEMKGPRLFA